MDDVSLFPRTERSMTPKYQEYKCLLESSWAVDWCQVVVHTLHTLLGPFTHLSLCHDDILREIKHYYIT